MDSVIALRADERAARWAEAKTLAETAAAEKRELNETEKAQFDASMVKIDSIDAEIKELTARAEAASAADEARARFAAVVKPVAPKPATDDNAELRRIAREGGVIEYRDISKSTFTNPVTVADKVYVTAGQVNPFLNSSVVDLITVSNGNAIAFPRVTALGTAAGVAEAGSVGESDGTNSTLSLTPAKYATLLQLSDEMVQDAAWDVSAYVAEKAGAEIAVAHGAVAAPAIAAAATVGKQGAAVTPSYADLIDLVYSVKQQYRRAPKRGFLMNDATLAVVMKLEDDQARPIFTPGDLGRPDTLLGFPVYSAALADCGDEALSIVFGDLSAIKTAIVGGVEIASSADYAFANGLVTFRVQVRGVSGLIDPSAVKSFKGANV
jgi:HK97 family phage major capsid protein